VLEFFVNSLRAGTNIRGYPDFIVTSIYVQSLMQAIWDLTEAQTTGTVHVASSDPRSKYDFGMLVAERFGLDSSLIARLGPDPDAHTTSRARDLSLSTARAASLLGRSLQTQAEGVAQAAADSQLRAALLGGADV